MVHQSHLTLQVCGCDFVDVNLEIAIYIYIIYSLFIGPVSASHSKLIEMNGKTMDDLYVKMLATTGELSVACNWSVLRITVLAPFRAKR